ncbi:MAG: hypothetical protein D3904_06760 [Candidatus Electrothrix sp. EH2]|nr:hypothetical protein [Candidatus Electrothrix sp. EH2]
MHDLGHTNAAEYEAGYNEFEFENEELEMNELEAGEFGDSEYEAEYDEFEYGDGELEGEYEGLEMEGIFSEAEEMELANELLNVSSDAELDQFLGKVFKRVVRKVRKFKRYARPAWKIFRRIGRRVLPYAGAAVGTYFGGPAGAVVGRRLGKFAGSRLEMEFEGMGEEEMEFEVARRLVRTIGATAKDAVKAPTEVKPDVVVKKAATSAVQKFMPYYYGRRSRRSSPRTNFRRTRRSSGRWVRRGNSIVILGI